MDQVHKQAEFKLDSACNWQPYFGHMVLSTIRPSKQGLNFAQSEVMGFFMFQCRVYIELKDIKLQIAAEICYVFFSKSTFKYKNSGLLYI